MKHVYQQPRCVLVRNSCLCVWRLPCRAVAGCFLCGTGIARQIDHFGSVLRVRSAEEPSPTGCRSPRQSPPAALPSRATLRASADRRTRRLLIAGKREFARRRPPSATAALPSSAAAGRQTAMGRQEPLDLPPGSRHPTSVATTPPVDGQVPNDRRTTLSDQQAALNGKACGQAAVRNPKLHVHALEAGVD